MPSASLPSGATSPGVRISATASAWTLSQLDGPARDVPVIHAGMHAIYLATADGCIGVLSSRATGVPCGVRTSLPFLPAPGPSLTIGAGHVVLDDHDLQVDIVPDVVAPPLRIMPATMLDRLTRVDAGRSRAACAELPAEPLSWLRSGDARAAGRLVGLGSGLTPLGDDVLCGWLATMWAAGCRDHPIAARIVSTAAVATTLLSATLLVRATSGQVVPEFRRLLAALDRDAVEPALRAAVDDVRRIGHTSGAGLLLGCLLALTSLTTRSTP